MNPTSIVCPNCQHKFSPDEAFSHQVEEKIEHSLRQEFNKKYLEEKKKLEEKIGEESLGELKLLREQFDKQKKELAQAHDYELELRKKTAELEEKEKNLELEKQRQIDEERKKIQEKTEIEITEKYHLKEKEKDSLINGLKKSLEDAQRKANQGSQQLQGEVMELELEETLRREFPIDGISEVGKGKFGADVLQIVRDNLGRECGKIIWESKRTRNFEEDWIEKLKDDQKEAKADMAILVSSALPKDIRVFGQRKGVHIAGFDCLVQVAQVLRSNLIALSNMKASSVGKNERIESLYGYITSVEFAQRIDSIVQSFQKQREQLEKDKMNDQKSWAMREKFIDQQQKNTMNIYGSLSGLVDEPLPQIASLEITTTETTKQSFLLHPGPEIDINIEGG